MSHTDYDTAFDTLARLVQTSFATAVAQSNGHLFTTDVKGLFDTYLSTFADPVERQHHNCNCCHEFIKKFGGLVWIDAAGRTVPAMWSISRMDQDDTPAMFRPAVEALSKIVARAKITAVHHSSETVWGTPTTGEWNHFAVTPPAKMVHTSRTLTAGQKMAESREEFGMLVRGLAEFSSPTFDAAVTLLQAQQLNRSTKFLDIAKALHELRTVVYAARDKKLGDNYLWYAVASSPAGFCHVKSGMIGTLLTDIQAGLPLPTVKTRFDALTAPSVYQRATVAPKAGAVKAAEDLVEKLGIAPSLPRRFATLADLVNAPTIWALTTHKATTPAPGGVFGHIKAKGALVAPANLTNLATTSITWDKFQRTVLPLAKELHALVPNDASRFMALVTAADPTAPAILNWGNSFSWYYASGIDAEIKKRVTQAGGQYENVDIRASLIWNNRDDLDLHVRSPRGGHIYYGEKRSRSCSGWLDVDMNISGETSTPIENIRWPKGEAQSGAYRVWVENYNNRGYSDTPYRVELEVAGQMYHYDGVVRKGDTRNPRSNIVASFHYEGATTRVGLPLSAQPVEGWGVQAGSFAKVNAVVPSPNLWGEHTAPQNGQHAFFLLEGCQDSAGGRGRGFFTEMLKNELRPARATLEAYNASAVIAGADQLFNACGLGISADTPMDLTLRVLTAAGVSFYKIDRWD